MELKLVKILNKGKKYLDKNGRERTEVNYYLVANGVYIAVKPCFSKGYVQFDMLSELIVNGSKDW